MLNDMCLNCCKKFLDDDNQFFIGSAKMHDLFGSTLRHIYCKANGVALRALVSLLLNTWVAIPPDIITDVLFSYCKHMHLILIRIVVSCLKKIE